MPVCFLTRQNGEDLGERGGRKDLEGQETIIRTHFMRKIYFQLRKQCFFLKKTIVLLCQESVPFHGQNYQLKKYKFL